MTITYLAVPQVDVEVDELRVFADEILNGVLLKEVMGLLLQEERDLGAPSQGVSSRVLVDAEALGI